ncbi:MAG: DUF4830 domain-containing protein [Oscillospiraceae bacterium]
MSRKTAAKHALLIIIFAVIAVLILVLAARLSENTGESKYEMSSNAMRVEFLNSCGLIVKPDPEVQEIKIPRKFGTIYEEYNRLQQSQGFDLTPYAGREAVLCSYTVLNCPEHPDNVVANLLLCDGKLIACDLTLNEENGFTQVLITDTQ